MICEICGKHFSQASYAPPNDKVCSSEYFTDKFWLDIINEKDEHVVINGKCYYFDKSNPIEKDDVILGYGGAKLTIKLHTGETYITNNLWSNGEVPEKFRDRLPDNAQFVR